MGKILVYNPQTSDQTGPYVQGKFNVADGIEIKEAINDNDERIEALEASSGGGVSATTFGDMTALDAPKVLVWGTALVPGDTAGRTYLQKHGALTGVGIFIEVPSDVQDQVGIYIPGGQYRKSYSNPPTLTIDNQGSDAHYIIK